MTRRETDRIFECRGCRCETCRWRAAGSNCYYNEYVAFRQEFSWEV